MFWLALSAAAAAAFPPAPVAHARAGARIVAAARIVAGRPPPATRTIRDPATGAPLRVVDHQ